MSDSSGRFTMSIASSMVRFVWRMGSLAAGLGAVVATVLYFKQDSLLYFPEIGGIPRRPGQNPRRYRSPAEHQVPFLEQKIECADGVSIHTWLLLRRETRSSIPTLVFFHGNAGNIGLRLPNALQMMQFLDCNVLMVEYRGYGDSDSVTPSEHGLKLDSEAALDFVLKHPKIDATKVFLFGRSLGGAVAFHLAQYAEAKSLPLAGVIVENTFLSISHMVDHLMPYVSLLKPLVLRIGWDSSLIVPRIKSPILYLAGAQDQLVPHEHMLQLWRSSKMSRLLRIHVVPDGTHNETWFQGKQPYWDAIKTFLAEATQARDDSCEVSLNPTEELPAPISRQDSSALTESDPSDTASSIPIMPTGLVGMARESTGMRDSTKRQSLPEANKKDK